MTWLSGTQELSTKIRRNPPKVNCWNTWRLRRAWGGHKPSAPSAGPSPHIQLFSSSSSGATAEPPSGRAGALGIIHSAQLCSVLLIQRLFPTQSDAHQVWRCPPVQQLWTPAEHVLPLVQHPPFSLSTELTSSNFNVCLVLSDSIIVKRVNASLFTLYYNGCWKLKRATQETRLSALLCININC